MSQIVLPHKWDAPATARSALQASAVVWFVPVLIGQWIFANHIAAVYFSAANTGNFAAWNKRLFVGLIDGDHIGNAALVAHLFIAFALTIGGTLQFIPQLRNRAPAFHRWNGRVYIVSALVASITGIYMIWTRDTFGGILMNDIGITLNGVLILIFAAITIRYAMARNIAVHQRWALRTFFVVSGVWFLRVFYAFLSAIRGELPGIAEDMTGPTNVVINFASYLVPLAVLELYFRAKTAPSTTAKFGMAGLVLTIAVCTGIGVYARSLRWLS